MRQTQRSRWISSKTAGRMRISRIKTINKPSRNCVVMDYSNQAS